ncbi:peptidase S8/S53 domain-containing protein [Pyronema omphalodes]|nr:peptidase S8/S53 domain-containing protein [Pyronema omphalodes]
MGPSHRNYQPIPPKPIPNRYIVVFKPGTVHTRRREHCERIGTKHREFIARCPAKEAVKYAGIHHEFCISDRFAGYSCTVSKEVIEHAKACEHVHYIEPAYTIHIGPIVPGAPVPSTQFVAEDDTKSWGLARISQKERISPNRPASYKYHPSAGKGITAYVIDSGCYCEHEDFEGRAVFGFNAVEGSTTNADELGHGTHVAGIICGKNYGVARKANLIAIKVFGSQGAGNTSEIINAINWAVADAKQKKLIGRSVMNMSLGVDYTAAFNAAVAAAVEEGMVVVCAAGNESIDASKKSPASAPGAIAVGNIDINDTIAPSSNYGTCVDIFAPGTNITSTYPDGPTASKVLSGTSMAAPHATGVAAYLMSLEKITTPQQVMKRLKELAVEGAVTGSRADAKDLGGSQNLLLQNGADAPPRTSGIQCTCT